MNKGFKVSAIEWDLTDHADPVTVDDSTLPTDLPSVVEVWMDDVEDGDLTDDGRGGQGVSSDNLLERILDEVSDKYGWCINNCTVTVINEVTSRTITVTLSIEDVKKWLSEIGFAQPTDSVASDILEVIERWWIR